ncbi:MAG: hypothetical protein ABI565_12490, partial [Vicinamibacteria bacterium]
MGALAAASGDRRGKCARLSNQASAPAGNNYVGEIASSPPFRPASAEQPIRVWQISGGFGSGLSRGMERG